MLTFRFLKDYTNERSYLQVSNTEQDHLFPYVIMWPWKEFFTNIYRRGEFKLNTTYLFGGPNENQLDELNLVKLNHKEAQAWRNFSLSVSNRNTLNIIINFIISSHVLPAHRCQDIINDINRNNM
mgnify:CR=1 FL=1|jgi:hypothetical protein